MQIDKNTTDRKTNPENSTLKPTRRADSAPSNRADGTAAKPQHDKSSGKRADVPETERKAPAKATKGKTVHRDGKKTANAATAAEKPAVPSSAAERDSDVNPTGKGKPSKRRFPSMDAIRGKIQKPGKREDGTAGKPSEVRLAPRVANRRVGTEPSGEIIGMNSNERRHADEIESGGDIASTFTERKRFGDREYSPKAARRAAYGEFGGTLDASMAEFSRQGHAGSKILAVIRVLLGIVRLAFRLVVVLLRSIWRAIVYMAVAAAGIGLVAMIGLAFLFTTSLGELPSLKDYTLIAAPQDSTMYDADGQVIGVISTSSREPVSFGSIDQKLKDATVGIEDERFYNHEGVDFYGIARALKANFDSWRGGGSATSQGASTITQQYEIGRASCRERV